MVGKFLLVASNLGLRLFDYGESQDRLLNCFYCSCVLEILDWNVYVSCSLKREKKTIRSQEYKCYMRKYVWFPKLGSRNSFI